MLTLNYLLCAVASLLVAYAAARQANVALTSNYTTGILLIPLYPFYWVEVVSMIVLCIAFLLDMTKSVRALFNREIAEEIQGEWS